MIIKVGGESLSRVMCRGLRNVSQLLELLPVSVVSLGKSSQSTHISIDSSHNESGRIATATEKECIITHLNGNQFRQVYSLC